MAKFKKGDIVKITDKGRTYSHSSKQQDTIDIIRHYQNVYIEQSYNDAEASYRIKHGIFKTDQVCEIVHVEEGLRMTNQAYVVESGNGVNCLVIGEDGLELCSGWVEKKIKKSITKKDILNLIYQGIETGIDMKVGQGNPQLKKTFAEKIFKDFLEGDDDEL